MKTPQSHSLSLSRALPVHAAVILALARAFHREDGHPLTAQGRAALQAALKKSPHVKVWRILRGRAVCGYAVVTYGYSIEFGGLAATLDDLYVMPKFRGGGIGAWALAELENRV